MIVILTIKNVPRMLLVLIKMEDFFNVFAKVVIQETGQIVLVSTSFPSNGILRAELNYSLS